MVKNLKQQKSKKIVTKKVSKAQEDSSQKDNLDFFDSSIVVNNNLDKCALCKVANIILIVSSVQNNMQFFIFDRKDTFLVN